MVFFVLSLNIGGLMAREVSGILPVISHSQILMITNDKGHYIFPKGGIKRFESSVDAAQREANEEAGISGVTDLKPFISKKNIEFYIMKVDKIQQEYLESDRRKRIIVTPKAALEDEKVPKYVKEVIKEAIKLKYIE